MCVHLCVEEGILLRLVGQQCVHVFEGHSQRKSEQKSMCPLFQRRGLLYGQGIRIKVDI